MQRLISLSLLVLLATAALADTPKQRYIVMTRPNAAHRPAIRALGNEDIARVHAARELGIINGFAAELTAEEVNVLKASSDVRSVEPVVERHLLDASPRPALAPHTTLSPLETSQTVPYGIDLVRARELWPMTRGANINVAIFDTGITLNHPDLAANIAGGYNVLTHDNNFADDHFHGTHVAGIVAAADNGIGVVGVAPQARIWMIKILGADGNGTNEDLVAATDWVLAKKNEIGGHWIISMSLGSQTQSPAEKEAFQRLADNDVLSVSAAGNSGFWALDYPAAYASVLSVGAVDADKKGAWFSSGGGTLGVMAPGVDVLSTAPLGSSPLASAFSASKRISGLPLKASGRGEFNTGVVSCGFGAAGDCGATAAGKIAVIARGNGISFTEKALNAIAAGAVAIVIYNFDDTPLIGTLIRRDCANAFVCTDRQEDLNYKWPPVIGVSKSDGEALANLTGNVYAGVWDDDYSLHSGTSMATPHVAGVAALLWALAPDARASEIRRAIELTAQDLGPVSFDPSYGNGLIDAVAAAKALAPQKFGLPAAPVPQAPHRRVAGH